MKRLLVGLTTATLIALAGVPASAQNPTAAGAAQGAATGGAVAGPVGSFVGGVTGAAVGTAAGVADAVTSPFRPRHHRYYHGTRRRTCVVRPSGTRRCRTVYY